ncbi:MAG: hypothetical protein L0Z53_23475 [Acidobacteriales bacterium]|nr:hypothetical protein [Terriglobales bacterium]
MEEQAIRKLEQRIARLEKAVFGDTQQDARKKSTNHFRGASGGVRLLISKGFFKKKRGLSDVRTALSDSEYHYSRQAVHAALSHLSAMRGPLVSLQEGGRTVYVERK